MKESTKAKGGIVLLCALLVLAAAGCAKKQTVKTQEGAGAPSTGAAAKGAGPGSSAGTGGSDVTSSSVPTEKVGGAAAAGASAPLTPTELAKAEAVAGEQVTKEKKSEFSDIHFDFDQYAIRDDAKPVLEKVADYLRKNRGARLTIEGHCDERGTSEYNMALGERRAEATKKYLSSLGADGSALSTVSLGEEKPLDLGHDESAWAKNRRAHFVLP